MLGKVLLVLLLFPLAIFPEIIVDPLNFSPKVIEVDLSFNSFFKITRIYNFSYELGVFGKGWNWNLDSYVRKPFEDFLEIRIGDDLYKFLKVDGIYRCLKNERISALEIGKGFLVEFPEGLSYFLDRSGKIREISFQENSITLCYENGKIVRIEDNQGNSATVFYNPRGFISKIVCSNGRQLTYKYEDNLLKDFESSQKGKTRYLYDEMAYLRTIIHPDGSKEKIVKKLSNEIEISKNGKKLLFLRIRPGVVMCFEKDKVEHVENVDIFDFWLIKGKNNWMEFLTSGAKTLHVIIKSLGPLAEIDAYLNGEEIWIGKLINSEWKEYIFPLNPQKENTLRIVLKGEKPVCVESAWITY